MLDQTLLLVGSACVSMLCIFTLTKAKPLKSKRSKVEKDYLKELFVLLMQTPAVQKLKQEQGILRLRKDCIYLMPQVLDVLSLGLQAGLSFDASLALYCENFKNSISSEFESAQMKWRIGLDSRQHALLALVDKFKVAAFKSFANLVIQSLEFGSPLAQQLQEQAQTLRDIQRSEIEEQIEKVPVKMLIPLGTLIVPAMLLSILGPLIGSSFVVGM